MPIYRFTYLISNIQYKILLNLATNYNFISQEYTTKIRTIIKGSNVFVEVIDNNIIRINKYIIAYLIIRTLYIYIKLIVFNMS